MARKDYDWKSGAVLEDHSRRKHQIIRQYVADYIAVRCGNPHQREFRIAIFDAFAGGGIYSCGSPGSPIVFINALHEAVIEQNQRRSAEGLSPLSVKALLILNDSKPNAFSSLKHECDMRLTEIRENSNLIEFEVHYFNRKFEELYPTVKQKLITLGLKNVLFNLDQYGYIEVKKETVRDILYSFRSAEVFLTFSINALKAYLPKKITAINERLNEINFPGLDRLIKEEVVSNEIVLGQVELLIFQSWQEVAPFFSPFSIHNPKGWRYWMMHFANVARARQVYNGVLHTSSSHQAHFGLPGLNMLGYSPKDEGAFLYLFEEEQRARSRSALMTDIPRFLSQHGRELRVSEFNRKIYNATPAHYKDVEQAIFDCDDLEVVTERGGVRRSPSTIEDNDIVRLKRQLNFFGKLGGP